ncbi:unknown [Prevotella sp. CAG:1092]|nr:unknown [Prevotella sp. CAG:1092]
MHSLNNHNGVVDHNGNSQQQCRKYQQVDREAEHPKEEECTEQRYWHGYHRDESRTEVLQEDVNHSEHQQHSDDEGEDNLLHRCEEEVGNVVVQLIFYTRRERLSLLFELSLYVLSNLCSVRTSNLLYHSHYRRLTVVLHTNAIHQTTKLYLSNVFQTKSLTISIAANDDIAILLSSLQTTLIAHSILVSHIALLTKLTRSSLNILLSQSCAYVRRDKVVLLHLIRLKPYTHRICLHTRRLHSTHTTYTLQCRNYVDIVVVGKEFVIISSILCGKSIHDNVRSLLLVNGYTNSSYFGRKQSLSLRNTVLNVYGSHIRVGTLLKVYGDRSRTIVGGLRSHVCHVLHTVDTLLKRSNHGVEHSLCISTSICCAHRNGRRSHIRILLNRERDDTDGT